MNKYEPYSPNELKEIIQEPWEISDKPYKLHAAFAISCLFDWFDSDEDDEESENYPNYWGRTIPKKMLDRMIKEIAIDFNDSAKQRKQIKIFGKGYSIRKVNAYDHERLNLIFNFPLNDSGEYEIVPEGILDLSGTTNIQSQYEVSKDQFTSNRNYLRQIIKLAEDDENNGWDKLTDMEVLIYCWATFYNEHQVDNYKQFLQEYENYIYVSDEEIKSCLNEKSTLREKPVGMYAFSQNKVMEWNSKNNQQSVARKIPIEEAENYWYNVALLNSFKPLDLK